MVKIMEQIPHLDPSKKDVMNCEINQFKFPIEECFAGFCDLIQEGLKDPVLKILFATLNLIKETLPMFFRSVEFRAVEGKLTEIIISVLEKSSDLKVKVRESSETM